MSLAALMLTSKVRPVSAVFAGEWDLGELLSVDVRAQLEVSVQQLRGGQYREQRHFIACRGKQS